MRGFYNILFLCRENAARSIMAEAYTNSIAKDRFQAFSAGQAPAGQLHPLTVDTLENHGLSTAGMRSKSWDEFLQPDAPPMDFVISVCDKDAGEICPVWPNNPITARWNITDPAMAPSDEQPRAFLKALRELENRIRLLTCLRLEGLDRLSLKLQLDRLDLEHPPLLHQYQRNRNHDEKRETPRWHQWFWPHGSPGLACRV